MKEGKVRIQEDLRIQPVIEIVHFLCSNHGSCGVYCPLTWYNFPMYVCYICMLCMYVCILTCIVYNFSKYKVIGFLGVLSNNLAVMSIIYPSHFVLIFQLPSPFGAHSLFFHFPLHVTRIQDPPLSRSPDTFLTSVVTPCCIVTSGNHR